MKNVRTAVFGSVLAVDPAMFKRVLDVNVLGVFHTVRATLPAVVAIGKTSSNAVGATCRSPNPGSSCGATLSQRISAT